MIENVKHSGLALAILAGAQFMVVLDVTITNVALPAIRQSLGFQTDAELQWVITAYALAFGGFLLLGGRLADLFGRRKMFLTGAIIFALASFACGLAQNPVQLIVFRALQGLGGALLSPSALSLVLTIFAEGQARTKAIGVWSMVAAGGGAVGLLLGGVLTQYVDWRWIFFINLPIAALIVAMAMRFVPASLPRDREPVDVLGAITITGSLMSLVYALARASDIGWGARTTVTFFAISAVLMAWFIINELRSKHPLMRLGIFRQRNVTGANLVMLLMPAAMFGLFFYLSIFMQQVLQYTPTHTGVANLPFTFTIMVVAATLSRKVTTINPKAILIIGPLLVAIALMYFARVPVDAKYWTDIFPGIVIMATGMAMVFVTATSAATSGVSQSESGLVSGLLNTGQQIGGAIGLAVLTVISTNATRGQLQYATPGYQPAIDNALVYGFHRGFIAAACFALGASLVAALVFKVRKPSAEELALRAEAEA